MSPVAIHWQVLDPDAPRLAPERSRAPQFHLWWQALDLDENARRRLQRRVPVATALAGQRAVADQWLRLILASYLRRDPGELRFARQPKGRPHCIDAPQGFDFNLSHSGTRLLIAIAAQQVGADLESTRRSRSIDALAGEVLHADEQDWLERQTAACRVETFMRLWVAKEALLKAHGMGVWDGIRQLRLGQLESALWTIAAAPASVGNCASWRAFEFAPDVGYRAAIAFEQGADPARLSFYQLTPDQL